MNVLSEVDFFSDSFTMKTKIPELQDKIGMDVLGVIWITEKSLIDRPFLFDSLDYFVDGLLTNYYQKKNKAKKILQNNEKNFFVTQSFGSFFFLGHAVTVLDENNSFGKMHDMLDELMKLATTLQSDKKSVLFIDVSEQKKENLAYLQEKYDGLSFSLYSPKK